MRTRIRGGLLTPEQYLQIEQCAETKSEYIAGTVRAMAGASVEHSDICFNLSIAIGNQIQGTACRGNTNDLRLWIAACERYYYPDAVITCGSREFELRAGLQALINPTVIFEVLSRSTEAIDRGEKFLCYREIESLAVYVLIAQDAPRIEVLTRDNGGWKFTVAVGRDAEVTLPVANCTLRLVDIYENVEFPAADPLIDGSTE